MLRVMSHVCVSQTCFSCKTCDDSFCSYLLSLELCLIAVGLLVRKLVHDLLCHDALRNANLCLYGTSTLRRTSREGFVPFDLILSLFGEILLLLPPKVWTLEGWAVLDHGAMELFVLLSVAYRYRACITSKHKLCLMCFFNYLFQLVVLIFMHRLLGCGSCDIVHSGRSFDIRNVLAWPIRWLWLVLGHQEIGALLLDWPHGLRLRHPAWAC